jgi:hypothetical protein
MRENMKFNKKLFIPNKSGNFRCFGLRGFRVGLSFRRVDRWGREKGEEKVVANH